MSNKDIFWNKIRERISTRMNPGNFELWIAPLQTSFIEDGEKKKLLIIAPNRYFLDWIQQHYINDIEDAGKLIDDGIQIQLVLPEIPAATPQKKETRKRRKEKADNKSESEHNSSPTENTGLIAKFTFNNYVMGPNNQFAHTVSQSVVQDPGGQYNPLYIYGGTGLGKTHLVHAIGLAIQAQDPTKKIRYMSSSELVNRVMQSFQQKDTTAVRRQLVNCDVLLLDDIQSIAGKKGVSAIFFDVFNDLYNAQKQIVLTSDVSPIEIENLEERIKSRFSAGLAAEIQPPELEMRFLILKKKIELQIEKQPDAPVRTMSEKTLLYLAENIVDNVRSLEGALLILNAKAAMTGTTIDIPFIDAELPSYIGTGQRRINADQILAFVAKTYRVSENELKSKTRQKSIAEPRQIVMFLCKELTDLSFPAIGKLLKRDHTTILHGYKKINQRVDKDPLFRSQIDTIRRDLQH